MSSKPNQQQTIHISWIVQLNSWFHLTNRKAMENYHSQAEILALDQNLQWFYFYISWFVQQNSGFDLNYRLSMKNYSLQIEIFTSGVLNHHWNLTKPYQTKPNQTNWKLRFGQKILTSTTFTPDNFMILSLISELQNFGSRPA